MLLGIGEVEPVDGRSTTWRVRNAFFQALSENEDAREVFTDLADIPYQSFIHCGINLDEIITLTALWPDYQEMRYSLRPGVSITGLCLALQDWSERWHLNSSWCIADALMTLYYWKTSPKVFESLALASGNTLGMVKLNRELLPPPPVGLPEWEADSLPREAYINGFITSAFGGKKVEGAKDWIENLLKPSQYLSSQLKRKLKRELEESVGAYCDAVLEVYLSQRDEEGNPTWKLTEKRKEMIRNLRWTVQAQVLDKPLSDIADSGEKSYAVSTVTRAVNDTLDLLILPKNPKISPGFPRGQKQSQILKELGR